MPAKQQKKTSKTTTKRPTKKQLEMQQQKKRSETLRIVSIAVFAVSILAFCNAVISGEGFWLALHNFYLGVFGFGAYLLPFLTATASVFCALEKKSTTLIVKGVEAFVLIFILCSFIHVIRYSADASYWEAVTGAYKEAPDVINGGFFGALIGQLLLGAGKTAAIIICVVILFVDVMLLTGLTLLQLWKPVEKTKQHLAPVIEQKITEHRENRERRFNIDVELESGERSSRKTDGEKKGFADPDDNTLKRVNKKNDVDDEMDKIKAIFHPNNDVSEDVEDISEIAEENVQVETQEEKPLDDIIKKATTNDDIEHLFAPKKKEEKAVIKQETEEHKEEKPVEKMEISNEAIHSSVADYKLPPVSILHQSKAASQTGVSEELKANAEKLVDTLRSFGVETKITDICRGPTVTRYEIKPSAGVKISKITNLADDIALNLAASGVRIEAPIPNKAAVGIEVPNKNSSVVSMREIVDTPEFRNAKSKLTAGLGKDIAGNCVFCDVAKMPHLLIAGATGAGKSVCMNSIIVSILYRARPDEVKFLMIDPKKVEFSTYSGIPHLLVPVVTDPRKAASALGWAVSEMLQRYKMFVDSGVKDISGYNKMAQSIDDMTPIPQIVIFIDELSDLMMAAPNEVEDSICRLAQMARAAGMHLVIATQRPSVDVITGVIKANIPSRIALTVSSQVDSRTILDASGAEKLLGRGDMLYNPVGLGKPTRVQGCFLTEEEIEELVAYIKGQGESQYDEKISKEIEEKAVQEKKKGSAFDNSEQTDDCDPLLPKAVDIILELGSASTTVLQRKLKVGYARGARIVDQLEEKGYIGPQEGSKPRKVLITKQQWIEINAKKDSENEVEQIGFDTENNESSDNNGEE